MNLADVQRIVGIYVSELNLYDNPTINTTVGDLHHIREMYEKMLTFDPVEDERKAMRWLGFIQGVLYMLKIYTLEELKEHNRVQNQS